MSNALFCEEGHEVFLVQHLVVVGFFCFVTVIKYCATINLLAVNAFQTLILCSWERGYTHIEAGYI